MSAERVFEVRTPEQVVFRYPLAGPVERLCAWLLDGLCMGGLMLALSFGLGRAGRLGVPFLYIGCFLIQWGYFLWFEWRWSGATPGKRLLGIRVMQAAGMRCPFERLALRNFLRVVDFLPFLYGLGGAVMLLSRHGARLGDMAAGTVCVRVPKPPAPGAVAQIRTRYNSLKEDAGARSRIRQILTSEEAGLVVALALRRDLLEDQPRLDLFAQAGAYLRRRLRLGEHQELPDESLVMNVASVLLQEKIL
jgi:uncharacterized RDD family membrane protein YckC